MDDLITARIERAKWLLVHAKHAAIATVNDDLTPHNSPYFFMASPDLKELYWGSHPASQHSRNILRTGQLFVVLYEAGKGGGLYIRAGKGRIAEGDELVRALERHNQLNTRHQKISLPLEYYEGHSPQRMWIADTEQFWINAAKRDSLGLIIQDLRLEVKRIDLL